MSMPPHYPLIEGFWIRNYKAFRQIAVGSSFQQSVVMDFEGDFVPYELSPLTIFAGDGGTGKSTFLDAFAFLADCINFGIRTALTNRGGFDAIYHRGGTGPISIGVVYRPCAEKQTLTYILNIDFNRHTQAPFVETEAIIYRDHQPGSRPRPFLLFQNGTKQSRSVQPWVGATGFDISAVKRTDSQHLALAALAQFEDIPDIPIFKYYLSNFFVSCYISSNASNLSPPEFKGSLGKDPFGASAVFSGTSLQDTKTRASGNLALDLKRVRDKHPAEFEEIMDEIAKKLLGIEKINYSVNESGRSILSFNIPGHDTIIYPAQLGEGTLRLLSHLLSFEDPIPTPLLGIEDPAAFMGQSQILAFARFIQNHILEMGGTQFFATTNSNTLIDQMDPTDVWFLMCGDDGGIQTTRGIDELQFLGIDLDTVGPYWYSEYLYRELTAVR